MTPDRGEHKLTNTPMKHVLVGGSQNAQRKHTHGCGEHADSSQKGSSWDLKQSLLTATSESVRNCCDVTLRVWYEGLVPGQAVQDALTAELWT